MVGVDGIEERCVEEGKEMTFGQREPTCSLHNVAADRRRECFVCKGEHAHHEILLGYRGEY